MRAQASASLLTVFGDALEIATNPTLLMRFISLPQAAVLTILQSSSLVSDAEATVLLLLSEYLSSANGKACNETEQQQLNASIRYSCLSAPYLAELCDALHTPPLTMQQRSELW